MGGRRPKFGTLVWRIVGGTLLAAGCGDAPSPDAHRLLADVRTDLAPGVEVTTLEVLADIGSARVSVRPEDDWVRGQRLAELTSR